MIYVLYIRYISSSYSSYLIYSTLYNLSYHSSSHSSTGSTLDCALINQLASSNSSPSSYNIVLKASVTQRLQTPYYLQIELTLYLIIKSFNYKISLKLIQTTSLLLKPRQPISLAILVGIYRRTYDCNMPRTQQTLPL